MHFVWDFSCFAIMACFSGWSYDVLLLFYWRLFVCWKVLGSFFFFFFLWGSLVLALGLHWNWKAVGFWVVLGQGWRGNLFGLRFGVQGPHSLTHSPPDRYKNEPISYWRAGSWAVSGPKGSRHCFPLVEGPSKLTEVL